ncbi:MAG: helix-turn-helix domain-containing protein [Pirellulaceae bacterium]
MSVIETLRQAVADSQYTINSLAIAAGVSQPVLSRFVAEGSNLNGDSVDKLTDYLGLELVQRVVWDDYVSELRDNGDIHDAWKEHEAEAWGEYSSDAWKEHAEEAWKEYEADAWKEAVANGEWEEDDYEAWKEEEYTKWSAAEYFEWEESAYAEWEEEEYAGWEEQYLAEERERLESRDYVIFVEE